MLEIVRMGLERRDQITAIWAAAFEQDPLMRWVFPDDAARYEQLRRWWGFSLDNLLPGAELHGTRIDGCAAYWQPPQAQPPQAQPPSGEDAESEVYNAFYAFMDDMLGELAPARIEAFGQMHEHRPADPHWYLAVLGTSPPQQGRGLGGQVLAPVLARCDRAGLLSYLESSNPANVSFYLRQGFETLGELVVGDGVLITLMAREPRPPEDD